MLLEAKNTAISRLRERRRERILRNSDQRIRRILSGPDGTEVRNAPALEGGEGFKDLVYTYGTPKSGEDMATNKSMLSSSLSCISMSRLWKALLVGLIMRLAVSFLLIQNIIWPWIILYIMSACEGVFQLSSLWNADGHFFRSRLHLGLNIDLLSRAGFIAEKLWCFIKESLVIALSFILFNALFCVLALIIGRCCSL